MRTKIGFLGLVIAGLVIGSVVSNDAVRADATTPVTPVKHHHHHHIHGKITAVDSTSITIKVHHHHKKGSTTTAAAPEEKTYQITAKTKVEIVSETGKTAGSASDLKVGEHVAVGEHEGVAHVIAIGHHHHKRKPAA
jgi:hypothetical protein